MDYNPTIVDKVYILPLNEALLYKRKNFPGITYIAKELPRTEEAHLALKSYVYSKACADLGGCLSIYKNFYDNYYQDCVSCGLSLDDLMLLKDNDYKANMIISEHSLDLYRPDKDLWSIDHKTKTTGFEGSIPVVQMLIDILAFYIYCFDVGVSEHEFDEFASKFISTSLNPKVIVTLNGPNPKKHESYSFYMYDTCEDLSHYVSLSSLKGETYLDLFNILVKDYCSKPDQVKFVSDAEVRFRSGPITLENHNMILPRRGFGLLKGKEVRR